MTSSDERGPAGAGGGAGAGAERKVAGRYQLIEPVGRGGMGTVWLATDEVLRREVAIKQVLLPPGLTTEERAVLRERTMREARAAARLDHPSAVTVYDVVEDDGVPWLVMELVRSRSLAEVVRDSGPLSPARTAEVGLSLLGALEAAHRVGIVHRDVKPGNVLLREDGRVVLTDFGIATTTGDPSITSTGLLLGSPSYIAPERARGAEPGPASDLWSLGATLYTAVEGRPPFDSGEALPTLAAVITEPPHPFRAAGPLEPLLSALLGKDPEQRPDAAATRRLLEQVVRSPAAATTVAAARPEPEAQARADRTEVLPARPAAAPSTRSTPPGESAASAPRPLASPPARPDAASERSAAFERPQVRRGPPAPTRAPGAPAAARRRGRGLAAWATLLVLLLAGGLGYTALAGGDQGGDAGPGDAASGPGDAALPDPPGTAPTPAATPSTAPPQESTAPPSTSPTPTPSTTPTPAVTPTASPSPSPSPSESPSTSITPTPTPSRTSSPTPSPTPQPPDGDRPAGVPADFVSYVDRRVGYTVWHPAGWQPERDGPRMRIRDPAGGRYVLIDTTGDPKPDPEADWREQEPGFARGHEDYERISIESVDYRFTPAADWEFTYTDGGSDLHANNRGFLTNGGERAFALFFQTRAGQWDSSQDVRRAIEAGFTPPS